MNWDSEYIVLDTSVDTGKQVMHKKSKTILGSIWRSSGGDLYIFGCDDNYLKSITTEDSAIDSIIVNFLRFHNTDNLLEAIDKRNVVVEVETLKIENHINQLLHMEDM